MNSGRWMLLQPGIIVDSFTSSDPSGNEKIHNDFFLVLVAVIYMSSQYVFLFAARSIFQSPGWHEVWYSSVTTKHYHISKSVIVPCPRLVIKCQAAQQKRITAITQQQQ